MSMQMIPEVSDKHITGTGDRHDIRRLGGGQSPKPSTQSTLVSLEPPLEPKSHSFSLKGCCRCFSWCFKSRTAADVKSEPNPIKREDVPQEDVLEGSSEAAQQNVTASAAASTDQPGSSNATPSPKADDPPNLEWAQPGSTPVRADDKDDKQEWVVVTE